LCGGLETTSNSLEVSSLDRSFYLWVVCVMINDENVKLEIMNLGFSTPFCYNSLKLCCLLPCNHSKLFSICFGCFVCFGNLVLRIRDQKTRIFAGLVNENHSTMREIVLRYFPRQNATKNCSQIVLRCFISYYDVQEIVLRCSISYYDFHSTVPFHKTFCDAVISTRLLLAVDYNYRKPLNIK
jgi:hypothetical protein